MQGKEFKIYDQDGKEIAFDTPVNVKTGTDRIEVQVKTCSLSMNALVTPEQWDGELKEIAEELIKYMEGETE